MKYPLSHDSFNESLLFWLRRWTRNKVLSLSSHHVSDHEALKSILISLDGDLSLEEISEKVKSLRKIGFEGVKSYFVPGKAFYLWAIEMRFSSMLHLGSESVMEFLTVHTAGKSNETKKNYRNAMFNFFSFISKNNCHPANSETSYQYDMDISGWQGLQGKSGKESPAYLEEDQMYAFLKFVDEYEFSSPRVGAFYSLLFRLLFYTGLRISELVSVRTDRFIKNDVLYSLRVVGKGNKERVVFVQAQLIDKYLEKWAEYSPCKDPAYLFCALRNPEARPNTSSISHKISDLLVEAGIPSRKRGAHLFRHTYATLIYRKTQDLVLLQKLLGHSDPSTTEIYTHINDERKKESSSLFS